MLLKKQPKQESKQCLDIDGVVKVSAGNYGGKLGEYKILLRELFP